jgi:ubiquinone/menaquinone biosynthesis C-methylase UbiE
MRLPSIIDIAEFLYDVGAGRHQPRTASLLARYLSHIPPGERILDVGAGTGEIALEVERAAGAHVTACDVDLRHLRQGSSSPHGGRVVGDGQSLPFDTATFDAAYMVYVLHHIPDQALALSEVCRTLRPGGVVAIVEYDRTSGLGSLISLLARLTGRRCQFHSPATLMPLVEAAGFRATYYPIDHARFVVAGIRR